MVNKVKKSILYFTKFEFIINEKLKLIFINLFINLLIV